MRRSYCTSRQPPPAPVRPRRAIGLPDDRAGGRPLGDARHMALAPPDELAEHGPKFLPARRQGVLLTDRALVIPATFDQAAPLEALEAFGEDVGGDAFGRGEELGEAMLAEEEQIPDDEEGPPIAHEVQRPANRAGRAQRPWDLPGWARARHRRTLSRHLHSASDSI